MDTEKRWDGFRTESGIEVKPLYRPDDLEGFDYPEKLGDPGEYPYTRGPYPSMYRGRPWTMRQYAGFGTAQRDQRPVQVPHRGRADRSLRRPSICRPRWAATRIIELALGRSGQGRGRHRFPARYAGAVRRHRARPDVSTSMTINATAPRFCCCSTRSSPRSRARSPSDVTGTTQNDILKEYLARGTYIYPPAPSMRITTDMFAYCAERACRAGTQSPSPAIISGRPEARPLFRSSPLPSPTP